MFTTPRQKSVQILQPINAQLTYNVHKGNADNAFVITMSLKCCIIITTCRDSNLVMPLYFCVGGKCPGSSLEQVQKQYRIILTIMKTSSNILIIRNVSILYPNLTSRTHYIINILLELDLIGVFDLLPIDNSLQLQGYQQSLAGWEQKGNFTFKIENGMQYFLLNRTYHVIEEANFICGFC